jgi:hypothetical protein
MRTFGNVRKLTVLGLLLRTLPGIVVGRAVPLVKVRICSDGYGSLFQSNNETEQHTP